jgi:peptide/nickel transport system permease protein
MLRYILHRVFMLVPVLFGVTLVAFSLLHLVPGDPAEVLAGLEATKDDVDRIRVEYGLDKPLAVQYVRFVVSAAQGDLGISIQSRHPVRELLFQRLTFTLQLSLASILVASAIGLLAGIVSSTRQYSIFDTASMLGALFGISMPSSGWVSCSFWSSR